MFTKKQLIRMYLPILFDNASCMILGIISGIIFSNLGEHVISATSITGTVMNIAVVFISGAVTGVIIKVSQCFGSGDMDKCRENARQSVVLLLMVGAVFALLMLAFGNAILHVFFGDADELVLKTAKPYMVLYALSFPLFALYSVSNGIMSATGDFKRAMKNSIAINVINVSMSAVFIYVFKMGIVGAGIAICLSRGLCAFYTYWCLRKGTRFIKIESFITKPNPKMIKSILGLGLPPSVEGIVATGSDLIFSTYIVALGKEVLAASATLASLSGFTVITGNAMVSMSITVIGQCFGSKDMKMCRKYIFYMISAGCVLTVFSTGICFLFRDGLLGMYSLSQETFDIAKKAFFVLFITYALLFAPSMVGAACLRGCGDTKFSSVVSMLSLTVVKIPAVWFFTTKLNLGLAGVWLSGGVDLLVKTLFYIPRLLSSKWEKNEQK